MLCPIDIEFLPFYGPIKNISVEVKCRGTGMTAIIETSRLFNGKIYPKSEPRSCVVDVVNSLKFEFVMEYNDLDCAVKQIVSPVLIFFIALNQLVNFSQFGQINDRDLTPAPKHTMRSIFKMSINSKP